ncbi:ATP-binding protein [Spirillospora sp. CA-294931]|uniref:ATP-binding protein n=1 Tax=Spirillospora sp. CA-294931 TaxID=3240042 RepID=UPI003D8BA532
MAARAVLGWWRRRELRARLTLVTVLALAGALGLGGLWAVRTTERAVLSGAEHTARQRAESIEPLVGRNREAPARPGPARPVPRPLPGVAGQPVQILDDAGRLVGASADADDLAILLDADDTRRARDGAVFTVETKAGTLMVVGAAARDPGGRRVTVLAAVPLSDTLRTLRAMRAWVLVGVPLVILLLAATVWAVVGFTLRPVTALRRGAQEIATSATDRRLPVPATRDEIHELSLTLNDMLDRLAAAGARQRAFTADAAHELRSPLASLQTQLEVALAHPTGQHWRETVRDVLTDVQRLSRLAETLLALARLDGTAPAGPGDAGPADLSTIAVAVAERFERARVPVRVDAPTVVTARAAPHDLDGVLTNLVANAVRHAASRVDIAVRVERGLAVLTVADDGPGVPVADRRRVFERFTRLDAARDRDGGGAGLGLAIVAETVERLHGEVTLANARPAHATSGPGLLATVRIPAAP